MSSPTLNITQFIESLGGLHDATVLKLLWCAGDSRLEIEVDDLYANFDGLPEYQGPTKATFVFSQVQRFNVEADLSEDGLMVYDWKFGTSDTPNYACEISFSPGGRVLIECGHIDCVKG